MGHKNFGDWKLRLSVASLAWQNKHVQLDVVRPTEGVHIGKTDGKETDRLFQIEQIHVEDNESLDPYARGSDLIVKYPCSETRAVGAELYWRWAEYPDRWSDYDSQLDESLDGNESVGTLELIYSLETQLLDTHPDPLVDSLVNGQAIRSFGCDERGQFQEVADTSCSDAQAWIVDQNDAKLLIAVMPSDLKSIEVAKDDDPLSTEANATEDIRFRITCLLDSQFLEKGVIRRVRLFAAFGDGGCEPLLLAAARDFVNSEIPLTA